MLVVLINMPVIEIKTQEQFKNILFDISSDDEDKHAKTHIVVDFYADWCGPCKRFSPQFEKFSETYSKNIYFCKVNIDNVPEIAEYYEVASLPTFMFFDVGKEDSSYDKVIGANGNHIENRLKYFHNDSDDENDSNNDSKENLDNNF